ncbi:MAG: methylmalonyl-CoA mutase, partial [Deltaproteobacteria bacterium]|nr:methylmalonyl-CoA mutase [Deltaproteobacteria bacterium]
IHFKELLDLLKARGAADIPVFGGGIIPARDAEKLKAMGVAAVFGPGAAIEKIGAFVQNLTAPSSAESISSKP